MPYIEIETRYENTITKEIRNNENVLTGYDIAPIDGYVLHNNVLDQYEYNNIYERENLINKGYSHSSSSVEPDYDFETNPYDIYAIKEEDAEKNGEIY